MLSWRKVMVAYLVAMALLGGLLGLLTDAAGGSLNPFRDAGLPVNRVVQRRRRSGMDRVHGSSKR